MINAMDLMDTPCAELNDGYEECDKVVGRAIYTDSPAGCEINNRPDMGREPSQRCENRHHVKIDMPRKRWRFCIRSKRAEDADDWCRASARSRKREEKGRLRELGHTCPL